MLPKYTEFDDLDGTLLFHGDTLGSRMRAERRARGMESVEIVAALMRSRHRISISGRQYQDMENGRNSKGNPVHMRLDVFIAFIEIVSPPGGLAFARGCLSDTALKILGISEA